MEKTIQNGWPHPLIKKMIYLNDLYLYREGVDVCKQWQVAKDKLERIGEKKIIGFSFKTK